MFNVSVVESIKPSGGERGAGKASKVPGLIFATGSLPENILAATAVYDIYIYIYGPHRIKYEFLIILNLLTGNVGQMRLFG